MPSICAITGSTPRRVLPGANHFSILEQYLEPASAILGAIVAIAHGRANPAREQPA